jgi:anaerobic selenocysteine-containing dehydrogenase
MAETLTLDTACPLDCPDGCSLTVTVNDGRLLTVDATPVERAANPLTSGFICQKVKHHAKRVYGDDRVMTPLIRAGAKGSGEFRPATWNEAMDLVASNIRRVIAERGPSAVLPYLYNSSSGVLASNSYGELLGNELGFASLDHTICAATMGAAKRMVLGGLSSSDPRDIVHAKYIVVWGANPTISNTHLPPLINNAVREGGAKLVVIDPRSTAIASRAHRHLAIRPGTDVVLAAAIAQHLAGNGLLDESFIGTHSMGAEAFLAACGEWTLDRAEMITGIEAKSIAELAEEWATTRPATLRIGWGMERTHNGGSAIMSALALPVLMGHFGKAGAGILHSTGSANAVDTSRLTTPTATSTQRRRSVSQNDLGEVIATTANDDERIDLLIVQGANPAVMNLDQTKVLAGLRRDDLFTVVHEQVMTDTCTYADVVFPATTHFESADLVDAYGALVVQPFPAVIDRVGESKSNAEFFAELAQRFDIALDPNPEVMSAKVTAPIPFGESRPTGTAIQMVDTFPGHPDRRFHLVPPVYEPLADTPNYPLTLLSPANNKTINSMFGERYTDAPSVQIHPDDAALRSIETGQLVSVYNELADIRLTAEVTDHVRRGVVAISKGYWARSFRRNDGVGLNALIPRAVEPLAGGACFNDARVDIKLV